MRSVQAELAYELKAQVEAVRKERARDEWLLKVANAAIEWDRGRFDTYSFRMLIRSEPK
jgi:hypothetical protein